MSEIELLKKSILYLFRWSKIQFFFDQEKKNCLSEQKDFHKNVFISEKNIFGKYYISCFQRKKLFHVWKKSFKCILKKVFFLLK